VLTIHGPRRRATGACHDDGRCSVPRLGGPSVASASGPESPGRDTSARRSGGESFLAAYGAEVLRSIPPG
jgi:hypothetical protein